MQKLLLISRTYKKTTDHDKKWLDMIISWAPPNGISLVEQSRWLRLAERAAEIHEDTKVDCEIELTNKDIILIEDRLMNPQFLMLGLNLNFLHFVLDLKNNLNLRRLTIGDAED